MADADDLRRIALGLEGTGEKPHFDRTAYFVHRTYATLAADGRTANIKLTPDEQSLKCTVAPDIFVPVSGGWGRQGWTVMQLETASETDLVAALEMAWRHAVPKKPSTRK